MDPVSSEDASSEDVSGGAGPPAADAASAEVQVMFDRLMSEADQIADRLAIRPPEIEARERELDELEDLRAALVERTEAANERFGAAERLVEQSRARLVEIADAQRLASETLETANDRAAKLLADAEVKASALQAQAERTAVARVRRAEAQAADRLVEADSEAKRILGDAMAALHEAETRAAEILGSVQQRVDAVVDQATQARHADIDHLHAREREVEARIRELLDDAGSLASLPRAEPRRTPTVTAAPTPCVEDEPDIPPAPAAAASASTIDLTDVSGAISSAIDDWLHRRSTRLREWCRSTR